MTSFLRSLESVEQGYCVFEDDQVLTPTQLNSVAGFLDDQERLTRVSLLGVGILCGLNVSVASSRMTVSPGVGTTTDGDLLRVTADESYDRFKPYDDTAPVYPPFYVDGKMIKAWELVGQGVEDSAAKSLTAFAGETGGSLDDMVAVLYMESYVKDKDLCTGADCDNLGKDSVNTRKLLLVSKASISQLKETFATPDSALRKLDDVTADRALVSATITTKESLAAVYRRACDAIHAKLATALPKVYPACESFLEDVFTSDPSAAWTAALTAAKAAFAATHAGIQYYYGFLKDVVDAYGEFKSVLLDETGVCCPDLLAFPKHLLLGTRTSTSSDYRTGFYPSAFLRAAGDRWSRARFLARKLGAMLGAFRVPTGAADVRMTPSSFEEVGLEGRAIPFYYRTDRTPRIHDCWNYSLTKRGAATQNYSYNAASYGATGAALNPLASQIGRFPFFRVEGHQGRNLTDVVTFLKAEIVAKNLPFAIKTVMVGTDRTKVDRPSIRYTDLHRLHQVVRKDVVQQLEEVDTFGTEFQRNVFEAVAKNVIVGSSTDTADVTDTVKTKVDAMKDAASKAKAKLDQSYTAYRSDASWQTDVGTVVSNAGGLKTYVGKAAQTDFVTPFDAAISNSNVFWLDWIDQVIVKKDEDADDKLLFGNFLKQHPGAEHFGGVLRGGTLVLLYDSSKTVLADLMLPYLCCDTDVEEEPTEPILTKPTTRPNVIIEDGMRFQIPYERLVTDKLTIFETAITTKMTSQWQKDIAAQSGYFKESVALMGNVISGIKTSDKRIDVGKLTDPSLDGLVRDLDEQIDKVETVRAKLLVPNLDKNQRIEIERDLEVNEGNLSTMVQSATKYVATSKMDVRSGSDGFKAMTAVSKAVDRIGNKELQVATQKALRKTADLAASEDVKATIGAILKGRGLE